MSECEQCGREFKPWLDEEDELVEDICFMCDQDYQIGAAADGDMGCSG